MKKKIFVGFYILFFILISNYVFSQRRGGIWNQNCSYIVSIMEREELSDYEKKMLLKMREEEKLARDVYLSLYEAWGDTIFNRISTSEVRHMECVRLLLEKYEIKDPVVSDEIGMFSDSEMKKLYDTLVEKGKKSLKDALYVGATIEDLDIYDLDEAIIKSDNKDIVYVFSNLKKGSENHIRAFTRKLLNLFNIEYKAKYISDETLEKILNSSSGRGRRRGRR